jgi:hypothetical protein
MRARAALTTAVAFASVLGIVAVGGPSAAASGDAAGDARKALPIYYIGNYLVGEDEPFTREALYREWKSRRVADNRDAWVRKSVNEMFENHPVDPDYYGFWGPDARVLSADVRPAESTVELDLHGVESPAEPVNDDQAKASLQQLVWTATAAASLGSESITKVTVLVDGVALTELWGQPVEQPLKREPFARSGVWILSPVHGEQVSGAVTVTGTAVFFENEGYWTLRREGEVVAEGTVTAGGCCSFTDYSIPLGTLEPGRYKIVVADIGGTGFGPRDTKVFRAT